MFKFHSYFQLELVTSYTLFMKKRAVWNQLLTKIPHYLPSMTWEWHQAWLKANPHFQSHLLFLFVYQHNHQLVGIIPLVKTIGHLGAIPLKMLTLAGNRDHIKTIFIIAPEHQLPLLDLFMHYLTFEYPHWDLLTFRRLGLIEGTKSFWNGYPDIYTFAWQPKPYSKFLTYHYWTPGKLIGNPAGNTFATNTGANGGSFNSWAM